MQDEAGNLLHQGWGHFSGLGIDAPPIPWSGRTWGGLSVYLTKPTLQVSQGYAFTHPPLETNPAALTSPAFLTRHLLQGC